MGTLNWTGKLHQGHQAEEINLDLWGQCTANTKHSHTQGSSRVPQLDESPIFRAPKNY